ncbi:MAG: polysaccharide biosynthesis protein [Muribaculaceae bacterium]
MNEIFNFLKPLSDRTTPRWIILVIDMLIVTLSLTLVYLSDTLHISSDSVFDTLRNYCVVVGVFLIVSFFSKSYAYIIRLTALNDLFRTLTLCVVSMIVLTIVNVIAQQASGTPWFSMWGLALVVLTSFCLMTAERLTIKYLYFRLQNFRSGRRKAMIVGTNLHSVFIANMLQSEINGKYMPVALLSFNENNINKSYRNNFPVYSFNPDTFEKLVEDLNISTLIVDNSDLSILSSDVATPILNTGIKVLLFNQIDLLNLEDLSGDKNQEKNLSSHMKEVNIEDLLGRAPIITDNTLVRKNIHNEVIMITGACGSIGSEIVRQVAAYNAKTIICVDQAETPMHELSLEMKDQFPEIDLVTYMADVTDHDHMERAFMRYRPKIVIHAAAYKHVPMMEINPTVAIVNNVLGSKTVADLSVKYGVYKFVMVSTDKAVNPTNVMGATKRLAEIYTQSLFFQIQKQGKHTQFITTRFGNVLGSNGSVIPLFRSQIAKGGPVTITHREIIRYFMTIPEACSLVLEAGCMGNGGEIYIFDMGKPVKILDLATKMISLAGFRPGKDIKIVETGLRPGEKLYEELLNDRETTTATINEKIMIAKVNQYDFNTVKPVIDEIIRLAQKGETHDMILAIKQFVPEYHSNNSDFVNIDNEIAKNNSVDCHISTSEQPFSCPPMPD